MDKSFVTMEAKVCRVCGKQYESGSLLLDMRLRNKFASKTVTGYGLCPDDQQRYDEGFIALVEADPEKSGRPGAVLKPEDAYRTGKVVHLRRAVADKVFDVTLPGDIPMVFVEPGVIEKLEAMVEK